MNIDYFYVTDDIKDTLTTYRGPMLLLVTLSLAAYGTVFYSLKKFSTMYALETENLEIQKETGRLHEAALQLEQYANYDTLTGLPNRRFFFESLKKAVTESERHARRFALLYIDLDGFKGINDAYGHEVGDEVLITLGGRLVKGIRKTDFVARLGGDEFAVILYDIEEMTVAENLAKNIHEMLQEVIHTDSLQCTINASFGIALYPDTGNDCETLLRNADSAMYEIKRKGKGKIGIFRY
ncbi:MAG: GGDEF domain-containing protein [Sphaerochaeta sp.]|nr:GGDEF domain-containing protein [Sphaerochaeta sp.]